MSANLNAAEVLQGVVSTPAALEAVLNQGAMIVNDYVITIEAVDGGYKLIARRGSDEQAMVILNGVDAPVPDIKITDVVHGHDVTITVGDVAKTFYIHDGVDAPVPEIYVEAVQGGHKVIAAVGDTVKSFIVKDGVDGRNGVDGKDGYTPVKGKDYFDGQPGKDGRDGVDGKNGVDGKTPVKGVDYFDGKDGYTPVKGKDYFDGQPGKDGVSPVINVSDIENGHRVTITTGSDVQRFDVLNGKDGADAEGGTVEVDPTLSIEGMAADAKATGDAIKAIGSGGGAQVQSDYAQHDATKPDFIKNRPFWPAYSPVLLNDISNSSAGDFSMYDMDGAKKYPAPTEGKRYIFCAVGGNVYTGVAVRDVWDLDVGSLPGIGIVDEQDGNVLAVHVEIGGITAWFAKIPEFVANVGADNTTPLVIIEGENLYNKLNVPDDVLIAAPEQGMNILYQIKNLQAEENYYLAEALSNDVEIVVDVDGVETVYSGDDVHVTGDASNLQGKGGAMYACGGKDVAIIIYDEESDAHALMVYDEQAQTGSGMTVKSFKVNYPGAFVPVVEAKKLPAECLPDGFEGSVTYYVNVLNPEDVHIYSDKAFTTQVTMMEFFNALNGSISLAGVMDGMVLMRVAPLMCSIPGEYGAVTVAVDITDGVATYNTWYTAEYTG